MSKPHKSGTFRMEVQDYMAEHPDATRLEANTAVLAKLQRKQQEVELQRDFALQYGNIASGEAAHRLLSKFAPAEPAEEETKAERKSPELWYVQAQDRPNAGNSSAYVDTEGRANYYAKLFLDTGYLTVTIHPPVVPAPTETGPWQRIEDVPEGVYRIQDKEGGTWRRHGSCEWQFLSHTGSGFWGSPVQIPRWCAPFVAAEEG